MLPFRTNRVSYLTKYANYYECFYNRITFLIVLVWYELTSCCSNVFNSLILGQRELNDLERTRLSRCRLFWLLPNPIPPPPLGKLERRHTGSLRKRDNVLTGNVVGGGGGGAKSYYGEKAFSFMYHSILSVLGWQLSRRSKATFYRGPASARWPGIASELPF